MRAPFGAVVTAMVTPFTKSGAVNFDEAARIANFLAANGSDGILVTGTTGECPTLSHDEEFELWKVVKKAINGKAYVLAGTGSNCTSTSISSTKKAEKLGLDGAMVVVPYYNKPSQEGMYQHFKAIAKETKLPLIIYNIPGRTSRNMEPETLVRLTKIKNYVALKAACGDLKQIAKMRKMTPKSFAVYSGDDGLTLDILKLGGCGVISVASHVVGKEINKMIELYLAGKKADAEQMNKRLAQIFNVLFITTNPTPVKAAMEMLGFETGALRLPMIPATAKERSLIKKEMLALGIIKR
ncbi:MAG: 4-hydroxy-tetrahydrodipicolinate synthase [Candidatus Margulisiibacteriota bacterium]|jgi:4-hydroxy-tetrahydrodipicolinate synthase